MHINTVKSSNVSNIARFFPMASCMWHFPDSLHLTSLLQLLKGTDNV